MTIVHVCGYFPPHIGGIEQCVWELSVRQAKNGHTVHVFTSSIGTGGKKSFLKDRLFVHYLAGLEIFHTPIIFSLFFRLLFLSKHTVIHVHISHAFLPEIVYLVCLLRGFSYVAHVHLDVDRSGFFGFLLEPYKRFFLRRVLRSAAAVICLSQSQKRALQSKYALPGPAIVVLNGVDGKYFLRRVGIRSKTPVVLFVGRLTYQKRVDRLIAAVAMMQQKATVLIAGDGEKRKDLELFVEKLGLQNVIFLGAQRKSQLRRLYQKATVFALPSDREGAPLVLLEAMAAGVPVVASNISGIRELLTGAGVLVRPLTPQAFAQSLDTVIGDRRVQHHHTLRSQARVRSYTWEGTVFSLDKIYAQVQQTERLTMAGANI